MSTFGLDRIFAPRRVAIVGGSRRASSIGAVVLRNVTQGGFAGEIAVVNPQYQEIDGQKTFSDIKTLPGPPILTCIKRLPVPFLRCIKAVAAIRR